MWEALARLACHIKLLLNIDELLFLAKRGHIKVENRKSLKTSDVHSVLPPRSEPQEVNLMHEPVVYFTSNPRTRAAPNDITFHTAENSHLTQHGNVYAYRAADTKPYSHLFMNVKWLVPSNSFRSVHELFWYKMGCYGQIIGQELVLCEHFQEAKEPRCKHDREELKQFPQTEPKRY